MLVGWSTTKRVVRACSERGAAAVYWSSAGRRGQTDRCRTQSQESPVDL